MARKTLLSALLLSCLFVAPALAATAPKQVTKPIHAWKTENNKDKTGQFDNCVVKNMYDNGTLMMLAQNSAGVERLALQFPIDKMQKDQHFDLAIQIDRKDVFPVEAVAISSQILTIGIPSALPDQMRKGQLLHLRGPNDEVIYTMDGMDGAVGALRDCIMTQKTLSAPSETWVADATPVIKEKTAAKKEVVETSPAMPEPIAKTEPAGPAEPSIFAKVGAATTAAVSALADKVLPSKQIDTASDTLLPGQWHSIFANTAYSPDKLVPLKPTKQEQPVDYIWQKNGLFIGVKQKPVTPAVTLEKTARDYLFMLKTRCKGEFVAESAAIQSAPGYSWQIAEGACSNGKQQDSLAALLFVAMPTEVKVLFFEAPMEKGPDAVKARDDALTVIEQQLR